MPVLRPRQDVQPPPHMSAPAGRGQEICRKRNEGTCADGACPAGRKHVCANCSKGHRARGQGQG
eukprot:11201049-Lingulodinium_polyedra.AAC.1